MNQSKNFYIAIMAGGVGSRFWPASKAERPKQFLDILGVGRSLIQLTYDRILPIVPADQILIVTNEKYRSLVKSQLPDIPDVNILGEPSMNNTAPTVAWTALHINAINPDASFAILPSDHVILKEDEFRNKLLQAFDFSQRHEAILTLGIEPTRPDTGYGYIQYDTDPAENGIYKVQKFKEKPTLEVAQEYLDSGEFLWNSGMFIWSVQTILNAFQNHSPQILDTLREDSSAFATDAEKEYINRVYPNTESISIDYAILERSENVYTIPSDIGWSDLGTWKSLYEFQTKDKNHCVTLGDQTYLIDTKESIIRSDSNKIVVIKGLRDYIVVDEQDALLIYPKKDEQEIKNVVKDIL